MTPEQHTEEVTQQIKECNESLNHSKQQLKSLKFKDIIWKAKISPPQLIDTNKQQIHGIIDEYFSHVRGVYTSIHSSYPDAQSVLQTIEGLQERMNHFDAEKVLTKQDEVQLMAFEQTSQEACNAASDIANNLQQNKFTLQSLPSVKINYKIVEGLYLALNEYASVEWPCEQTIHTLQIDRANYFTNSNICPLPIMNEQQQTYGAYNLSTSTSQTQPYILGPLNNIQYQATIVVDPDGMVYCVGGVSNQGHISSSFHKLDTTTHKLQKLPDMLVKRAGASVCWAAGKIYVMGGRTDNSVKTQLCEVYDVDKKQWKMLANMHIGKARAACCLHEELQEIFIFFGSDSYGKVLAGAEKYSLRDNTWTKLQFNNYLSGFDSTFAAAIQINSQQILLFGGMRESAYFQDQMYFNRNIMLYCTTNDCFSMVDQALPIDFLPLANPVCHDGAILCIGTFMKSLGEKPIMYLDGAFVIKMDHEAVKVVNYTHSS